MGQLSKRKTAHRKSQVARTAHAQADDSERGHGYSEQERRDSVMTASIDSFPASDPPGWISSKARPREDAAAADDASPAKATRKKQRR